MFDKGFYTAKKGSQSFEIRTNGLILSLDLKLQLKITSPGIRGDKNFMKIEICTFYIEELQKENGDYCHWDSTRKPQIAFQKPTRFALKTLDTNSTV